ncbi:LPS export ABC transporter periplasmic protein LptC [Fulvivirga sp. RKSG066]|nr:LPS export ABC transporter periplasmic protein LptC [Fulvivirga aurantia]
MIKHLIFLLAIFAIGACTSTEQDIEKIKAYEGPVQEAENVELYYSEDAKVTTKLKAQSWLQYENGDQEFPKGIYMEFFDEQGNITSTLKANDAYYFEEEKKYRGRGDVVIKNLEQNQQLNTEELFWTPENEKMYTDKYVRIQLDKEVFYGRGLEAKQDFSWYVLKEVEGEFTLDDE